MTCEGHKIFICEELDIRPHLSLLYRYSQFKYCGWSRHDKILGQRSCCVATQIEGERESLSWWAESGVQSEAQLTNVKTLAPPSWFWHSILNCCDPGGFCSFLFKIYTFPCFRILKNKTGTWAWAAHNFVTSKPCLLPCQSFLRARSSPLKITNPPSQETWTLYKARKAKQYQYRTQYYWYKWKQALRDILVIYLTQNI